MDASPNGAVRPVANHAPAVVPPRGVQWRSNVANLRISLKDFAGALMPWALLCRTNEIRPSAEVRAAAATSFLQD